MESKSKQKMASSAINGIENVDSSDHWLFLEEFEAPMWADLTLCDLVQDETDDSWFDTCHEFHQHASSQLISKVFHPRKSITIQEPPSPKLPASVSKSRGKSYKTKEWEQKRVGKTVSNQQHPVKTLTRKSAGSRGSTNKPKPISDTGKVRKNGGPKTCSSSESGLTDNPRPKLSKSPLFSLASGSATSRLTYDHAEPENKKPLEISVPNSSHTSDLLSSLRMNLRKSYATRPAARMVASGGRQSEGCKSSSSKSSVGSPLDQASSDKKFIISDSIGVTRVSQPERNKAKVLNVTIAPAKNVRSLPNRQGNSTLASKVKAAGKAQQHTSFGKVLMPRKVNEQNQMINKETKKVGVGKRTVSLASIKETALTTADISQKTKSSAKAAQPIGNVQRASKQSVAEKNGTKKPVGLKQEKTNNRNRDKDTANPARKVYFR